MLNGQTETSDGSELLNKDGSMGGNEEQEDQSRGEDIDRQTNPGDITHPTPDRTSPTEDESPAEPDQGQAIDKESDQVTGKEREASRSGLEKDGPHAEEDLETLDMAAKINEGDQDSTKDCLSTKHTKPESDDASLKPAEASPSTPQPPCPPEKCHGDMQPPPPSTAPAPAAPLSLLTDCPSPPVTATSGLNRPHVVCLPQVVERLRLAWQRSEMVHELDGQTTLVEAFNSFPYPTSQEMGALARQCALPVDHVRSWFMMQRVRYGISWGEEDIHDTRHKLRELQRRGSVEEVQPSPETMTEEAASRPEDEDMEIAGEEDDYYDYDDDDDDAEEEEMMRAFAEDEEMMRVSNAGMVTSERKKDYTPAALWSAPPLRNSDAPSQALSSLYVPLPSQMQEPRQVLNSRLDPGPSGSGSDPLLFLAGQPGRLRSKKSRAQLMVLRRSFVASNWPAEAEVQRLQRVTGLTRHEIRKWFADSRYQLRRSGGGGGGGGGGGVTVGDSLAQQRMSSKTSYASHPPPHEWGMAPQDPPGDSQIDSAALAAAVANIEKTIKQEAIDQDASNAGSSQTKDEHVAKTAAGGGLPPSNSLNGHSSTATSSLSVFPLVPTSSPSSSHLTSSQLTMMPMPLGIPAGYLQHQQQQRPRKKTVEQTEVLRQAFLRCQWPTAEDYDKLEQITGLPRTQIIHWFGDTRYSFKHSRLRWIRTDERQEIAASLEQDARRAWLVRRPKPQSVPGPSGGSTGGFDFPQPSPGNWLDASNSSNSSVQTLDGALGVADFDRWYEMWDGTVQAQSGSSVP